MLGGMSRLMPTAEVGFVGMIRDEETLQPFTYAERLPKDLSGRQCYVLDPMLATGGSLGGTVQFLVDRGADHITCICLLAAPEGIEKLRQIAGRTDARLAKRPQRTGRLGAMTQAAELVVGFGTDDDDGHRCAGHDLAGDFKAVEIGHQHIHADDIRLQPGAQRQSFTAAGGAADHLEVAGRQKQLIE